MKSFILSLCFTASASAQLIVTDPIHTAITSAIQSSQVAHQAEVLRQWASQLEKLNRQIRQFEDQLDLQKQIKGIIGDPAAIAASLRLEGLRTPELLRQYGDTLRAARRLSNAIESLKETFDGTFERLDDKTSLGLEFVRQADYYKRFAAVETQAKAYTDVSALLDDQTARIASDLGASLEQLRIAGTQAEVDKLNVKVAALNGQLTELSSRRRDEADKLRAQQILNENQAAKERQDFLEKQIAEERATLGAAAAWQAGVTLTPTEYTRP
ncbi:MAG: hypothetical protein JWM32_1271 [Verrucomicrobia bacterium]|nr:hypothetical protein [Verrucomicrobiota bacterium]